VIKSTRIDRKKQIETDGINKLTVSAFLPWKALFSLILHSPKWDEMSFFHPCGGRRILPIQIDKCFRTASFRSSPLTMLNRSKTLRLLWPDTFIATLSGTPALTMSLMAVFLKSWKILAGIFNSVAFLSNKTALKRLETWTELVSLTKLSNTEIDRGLIKFGHLMQKQGAWKELKFTMESLGS